MTALTYERAADAAGAIASGARDGARYLGGGTNLVDLMRLGIEAPRALVDVSRLDGEIADTAQGGLRIGAGVTNSAAAADRRVRERYPLLARAILSGASAQIRNMATVGGNLMQRTRCAYFYDPAARCDKRAPGAGCDAVGGFNRLHAILGAAGGCAATHPSDMAVALAALDAVVSVRGADGARDIALTDLYRLPGETPWIETTLRPGELIVAVTLPPRRAGDRCAYRKVRDRASFAFALVSVAARIAVEDGVVRGVGLALGGVGAKPWRAFAAEAALIGKPATAETFRAAARAELAPAVALRDNAFKIDLAERLIVDTLVGLTSNAETAP